MYQFIKKGMREGVIYIAQRYGKANNEYMESYDKNKPFRHIIYKNANSLYGWTMSEYLPFGGFK